MQTRRVREKLAREIKADQSGIVLPLAMVMVVLISVVGAGLLVFVISDNSSAAQVNRGQQAFGMADAGVGVAQTHIRQSLKEGRNPTEGAWGTVEGMPVSLPGFSESVNVSIERDSDKYVVISTGNSVNSAANRKVQAVFQLNGAEGGVTAPKNYYAGTNLNMNNYTEMVDGDILVEGRADITNTLKLTNGDVLVKGYGNFPNIKTLTNGDFYTGAGAAFSNTTTVNNGNIYIAGTTPSGGASTLANDTTVTGGGIYIEKSATFSNNTKVTGGDVYVGGMARFGNLDIGTGGDLLVGGAFSNDNALKMDNGYLYVGGNARIQNATITNSRIYITGTADFVQTNNITNSVIYVGGDTTFSNSGNLTGTSMFVKGNVNFSNSMTFGTTNDTRYGNWRVMPDGSINQFNKTARSSTRTGIGATGAITGNNSATSLRGSRSYDNNTSPRFVATVTAPQPSNRMTFPFNPAVSQGTTLLNAAASKLTAASTDANQRIEAGRLADAYLDSLKTKAINQGNYREVASGSQELVETVQPYRPEQQTWPTGSEYNTVVYYRFPSYSTSNKVLWLINAGCTSKIRRGILVVENGDFSSYGTTSGFNGTIVLRNGKFDVTGDYCMNGFVNSKTSFSSSNSSRFNLDDVPPLSELNDPSSADIASWREVYE